MADSKEPRLIRLPEVRRRVGLSRASIYGMAKVGQFPRPLKLGKVASAWVESEVTTWIEARISESRRAAS